MNESWAAVVAAPGGSLVTTPWRRCALNQRYRYMGGEMRKIAIANRKGGVAKTTTAVHLAGALSLSGQRTLLIDCDSQGHCGRYFDLEPEFGLSHLIEGQASVDQTIVSVWDDLDLLSGGDELTGTQRLIAREMPHKAPYMLSEALEPVQGYDYVIIDTSPGFNELTINVLFYATEVLIPVSMEALAVSGFAAFMREVEEIQKHTEIEVRYIVPTFFDRRVKKSEAILSQLRDHFGDLVTMPINYSVSLSEAPAWRKTVFEYAPKTRGAIDYGVLAGVVSR